MPDTTWSIRMWDYDPTLRRGPDRTLTDGSERPPAPDLEDFETIADALAGMHARTCRECGALFSTSVNSVSKWGTVCSPCLRDMGCL